MRPRAARLRFLLTVPILLGASLASAQVSIRGRVIDETGSGLAGARIELVRILGAYEYGVQVLRGEAPEPDSLTRSDEKGFFETAGDIGGLYRLLVSAPDRLRAEHRIGPLVEPVELPTVAARRADELGVRVIDSDEKPVAGTRIEAMVVWDDEGFTNSPWWPSVRSGMTGDKGTVTLMRRASEYLELAAFAPGFVEQRTATREPANVTLTLEVGIPRAIEVRDGDGKAVGDVLVLVGPSRTPAGLTGEGGRLLVHAARRDSLELIAEAATGLYAEGEIPARGASEGDAEAEPIVLTLRAPDTVSGRVVDAASQRPLAGVWLSLQGQVTRSARDGSYSLPARSYQGGSLSAAAPGYLGRRERVVHRGGGVIRRQNLALRPALVAEGIVVDEDRLPIQGAEVRVGPGGLLRRSGPQGRFRFPASPNVLHQLRVSKSGFLTAKAEVTVEPRDETPFEVVLERGRKAFGYVVDLDEQPVAGARVRRWELKEYGRKPDSDTSTGEDGRFEMPNLGVGGFDLLVQASGFAPALGQRLGILEDESGSEADIDLGTIRLEPGASLAGRVVDQEGRRITGATVKAAGGMEPGHKSWREALTIEVTSDEEGRFVISDRAPGEKLNLYARHRGYSDANLAIEMPAIELPGTEDVTLVLAQQATLRGQVVDQQGRPVPKAQVKVFSPNETGTGGHGHTRPSDADGRFEETGDPGRVQLSAEMAELRSPEIWLEVAPGEIVEGVRLVVEPLGAVVEGVVVGANDQPVVGARIWGRSVHLVPQRTDGEGRFRLTGLDPGPFQFEVRPGGASSLRREIDLHLGVNTVEIRLPSVHQVHGQVLDQEGQGLGGVHVQLTGDQGRAQATSQADGTFIIEKVSSGEYQLHGRKEGYVDPEPERPAEVDGTSVFGLEVWLVPTGAVSGRLSGLEGGSTVRVRVEATPTPPPSSSGQGSPGGLRGDELVSRQRRIRGTVGPQGRFRIDSLGPGTWTVQAHDLATGRRATGRVVVESGGQARLDLKLEIESPEG